MSQLAGVRCVSPGQSVEHLFVRDIEEHDVADPEDVTPNAEKDPADWVTGGEPATGPQQSYLHTLAQEAGEQVPDDLTKADASREIDRLQSETHRG